MISFKSIQTEVFILNKLEPDWFGSKFIESVMTEP